MPLSPGTRLGPYEIRELIGAGGVGEVYRARDDRLKRNVAIKVLPVLLSADADRLRRFEQEAQAAGSLNHPNILAIYDVGTHDPSTPPTAAAQAGSGHALSTPSGQTVTYIVSELLEGTTLQQRPPA